MVIQSLSVCVLIVNKEGVFRDSMFFRHTVSSVDMIVFLGSSFLHTFLDCLFHTLDDIL